MATTTQNLFHNSPHIFPVLLATFIGIAVGFTEVYQRYTNNRIIFTNAYTIVYCLINGLFSYIGYLLIFYLSDPGTYADLAPHELLKQHLTDACLAGFGTIALFRAKFLMLTNQSGKDITFGPEIVIQTLLNFIDKEIDVAESKSRLKMVHDEMKDISFTTVSIILPTHISAAFSRLSDQENEQFIAKVTPLKWLPVSNQEKSYIFGYYIIDLIGLSAFKTFIQNFKLKYPDLQTSPLPQAAAAPNSQLVKALEKTPSKKLIEQLPDFLAEFKFIDQEQAQQLTSDLNALKTDSMPEVETRIYMASILQHYIEPEILVELLHKHADKFK